MKKIFFYVFFAALLPLQLFAQESIGGIVNNYLKVDSVFEDRVKIDPAYDMSQFERGDLVLLIQMTGATWDTIIDFPPVDSNLWHADDEILSHELNNTGQYEFLSIDQVQDANHHIVFTAKLIGSFTSGEKIQLVKVRESEEDLIVDDYLTAPGWDGDTGGVVAIFTLEHLILNDTISVEGKGFMGAKPDVEYVGGINLSDTLYYLEKDSSRAARRGEGGVSTLFPPSKFTRGRGRMLNAGGGGQGLYAGGGGGGNYGRGGIGGTQEAIDMDVVRSQGGYGPDISGFYTLEGYDDIAIFGGGGGTSTQRTASSRVATRGGNGGGIIFIIADSIIGNGHLISAKGETVFDNASAGAGGGGGGGCVYIDANGSKTNITINIQGGKGGDATVPCVGAGGSGGGGLFRNNFLAPVAIPNFNVVSDKSPASSSAVGSCSPLNYNGTQGDAGGILYTLETPLNGYYFNSVDGDDTICQGQYPNLLTGSEPKGGNGDFHFVWQKSTDMVSWDSVNALKDSLAYQPPRLYQTTYYRRYVVAFNGAGAADTSKVLTIFVYDTIQNNTIQDNDTICYGSSTAPITGQTVTLGGNSTYTYKWQVSNNSTTWSDASDSLNTNFPINVGSLTDTTYIRRIVTSALVCKDTSGFVSVTVLPLLENNFPLDTTQVICSGDTPNEVLFSNILQGGEPNYYEFEWLESSNNSSFTTIADSIRSNFAPASLIDTVYLKRIVKSGVELACKDTSVTYTVIVLPLIQNNGLIDGQHICAGQIPAIVEGTLPVNGNGVEYMYKWYQRTKTTTWSEISGETEKDYLPTEALYDTTYIYRQVRSEACLDQTDSVIIEVIPSFTNTIEATPDSLCAGSTPANFVGQRSTGGDHNFSYLWQYRELSSAAWNDISGAIDTVFQSDALFNSTYFRRLSTTDVCSKPSDSILITVFESLSNNILIDEPITYTCFNTDTLLTGIDGLAGGMESDYRFLWQASSDASSWTAATNSVNTEATYRTLSLLDSMYYRRIVYSGLSNECIDTTNNLLVRINPRPVGDFIEASDSICDNDTYAFKWHTVGNEPFVYQFTDGNTTYTSDAINADESYGVPLQRTETYQMVSLVDRHGCYSPDTNFNNDVLVEVFEIPQANVGDDKEFCGLEYVLNAFPTVGEGQWSSDYILLPDVFTVASISGSAPDYGSGKVIWTELNGVCEDSDTLLVTFYEQPEQPDAGDDIILDFYFESPIGATIPNAGNGYWQVTTGYAEIDDSTENATYVRNVERGENVLKWTIRNGNCTVLSDTLLIVVKDDVVEGLSPNNDGINDELIIRPPEGVTGEIIIFNQWGNIVYTNNNYGADEDFWDGKNMDNEDLPSDTYYYIYKESNGSTPKNGYIVLKR